MSALHNSLSNSGQGPRQLGAYRLLRELGRGGMGVVYLGVDRAGHQVAIKVLLDDNVQARRRFAVEARACARLEHPNVVRVLDVGESNGCPYVVLELLTGETLQELLKRSGALPPLRAAQLVASVARGLSHAHAQGILHRDIKPDNLMLCGERVVLADFGLARDAASEQERLTRTGQLLGTPAYMSPEQADGAKHLDGRSDIYSLGATLYALLVAAPPFRGSSVLNTLRLVMEQSAPLPSATQTGIPPALDRICRRSMAKLPGERYADAAQLAVDLEAFVAAETAPASGRARWVLPAAIVGGVLVLGVLGAVLLQGGPQPDSAGPPPLPPPPPPPAVVTPDFGPFHQAARERNFVVALQALPEGDPQAALYRADVLLELGRFAEAREALAGASGADPVWLTILQAWAAVPEDRPQAAQRAIAAANEGADSDPAALVKLAQVLAALVDPRAPEVIQRATALAPRAPGVYVAQAMLDFQAAGPGEATAMKALPGILRTRDACRRALELDPDCFLAWRFLIYSHIDRREWTEAHDLTDQLVARYPHAAWSHYIRAWIFKQRGTYGPPEDGVASLRRAIEHFSLALEHGYSPASGHLERGYAYFLIGSRAKEQRSLKLAAEDVLRSIERNDHAHAQFVLTLIYEAGGRLELALRAHERAIELEPENPQRYLRLFQYQSRLGDRAAAVEALERCLARCPVGAPGRDLAEQWLRENR